MSSGVWRLGKTKMGGKKSVYVKARYSQIISSVHILPNWWTLNLREQFAKALLIADISISDQPKLRKLILLIK